MTISRRVKVVVRSIGWGLAILLALAVVAAAVYFLVILPQQDIMGAHDESPFEYDKKMVIEKRTADGTPYTVNNSIATFKLDVAKPDAHSQMVFTNYADALAYGKEHGLRVLPSVQLILGRLKQFDDELCASLELAMDERRVQALTRLLAALKKEPDAGAVEYVAVALLLAGVDPDVNAETMRCAQASRDEFLATAEARPCGFWDEHDRLIRNFQSDRYLMKGLQLRVCPGTCLTLSRTINSDPVLREAFQTLQAFGTKLTNPAQSVSFEELVGLTPQEINRRYSASARFALISYSVSKEQSLIARLFREGKLGEDACLMALVIDAVRSGRLRLDPEPDSGWYDYQWYALETLLAPERGRESAKLTLTDAYRKRLENAFATSLSKTRETQIKRLPYLTIGCMGEPDEPPPKVSIAPDFSAEPTLTVYLRLGRAYRFLSQAMASTLGEKTLAHVRLARSGRAADEALRETAGFCYGLYELLCLEIGRVPAYLPDEVSPDERKAFHDIFMRWRGSWMDDAALLADARVAVPVAQMPDGGMRYWGTAGVRLEPVVFKYLDKPDVSGRVEAEFIPCNVYLPTDVFCEFSRWAPEPLTRTDFRRLCDSCRSAVTLNQKLGALSPSRASNLSHIVWRGGRRYWIWVPVVVGALFWRVRRARRWIVFAGVLMLIGWAALLVLCPSYRTAFLVRHVATLNPHLGIACEYRWVRGIPLAPRLRGLAGVLSDSDPQARYMAARFMDGELFNVVGADSNAWFQTGIKNSLLRGADDPNPEIASHAIMCLKMYHDLDVTDGLLRRLSVGQSHDLLCCSILEVLGNIGDPRTIKVISSFCDDPRVIVKQQAFEALGKFQHDEAQSYLWSLSESSDPANRNLALRSIKKNYLSWWGSEPNEEARKAKCDRLLFERVKNTSLPFEVRLSCGWHIEHEKTALEAGSTLIEAADSVMRTNYALTCLTVNSLRRHGFVGRKEGLLMAGIISNMTSKAELVSAAQSKSPDAWKQALMIVLSTETNRLDSDMDWRRGQALRALEGEPWQEPDRRRRRR